MTKSLILSIFCLVFLFPNAGQAGGECDPVPFSGGKLYPCGKRVEVVQGGELVTVTLFNLFDGGHVYVEYDLPAEVGNQFRFWTYRLTEGFSGPLKAGIRFEGSPNRNVNATFVSWKERETLAEIVLAGEEKEKEVVLAEDASALRGDIVELFVTYQDPAVAPVLTVWIYPEGGSARLEKIVGVESSRMFQASGVKPYPWPKSFSRGIMFK